MIDSVAIEAERCLPNEAGGLLVGYRRDHDVVTTGTIGAGPGAKRSPVSLMPDRDYQGAELDRLFVETNGIEIYVGEWHSHPNGNAQPSRRDRKTMRNIATSKESASPAALMLILERDVDGAWSGIVWSARVGSRWPWRRLHVHPARVRPFSW